MNPLQEQLIQATIAVGAAHPANKGFSTKRIAAECGVSEFSLFRQFPNKTSLIHACLHDIMERFVNYAQSAWPQSENDPERYTSHLLDYFIAKKDDTLFLLNYGAWIAQSGTDAQHSHWAMSYSREHAPLLLPFAQFPDEAVAGVVFLAYLRQLIYTATMVLEDSRMDAPSYRKECVQLLLRGLDSYRPDKEAH
jgi:AcrR family transcriptional regulator